MTVTVASVRAERSVREKARWLGVLGVAQGAGGSWGWLRTVRKRAESREREEREKKCVKWVDQSSLACFGKWFTENFSVNHFPFFPLLFYSQKQIFSV